MRAKQEPTHNKANRSVLCILTFTLLLAACAGGDVTTSGAVATDSTTSGPVATDGTVGQSTGDESAEAVELVVFGPSVVDRLAGETSDEVQAAAESAVLEGFAAESPGVSAVRWPAEGPVQDAVRSLMAAHLAGEQFDLIACSASPTNGAYARAGVLRDITDDIEPFRDRFDPDALEAWTFDGRVLGIPVSPLVTSTFFYNVEVFDELGIEPPQSYEEFVTISDTLSEADYIPVFHQGSVGQKWPMWYFEAAGQTMGDPVAKTISNLRGETNFIDPEDVAAFRAIRAFVDDGILDPDSLGADVEAMRAAFASERSAIYYGGTWELGWILDAPEFEVGVFPFPQLPDVEGEPLHGGGPDLGLCLYEGIAEENVQHAIDFLEYVSRPEVANIYLEPVSPPASAINGVTVSDLPIAEELREENFPHTTMFLDWIWPAEISDAFGTAIQGIVGGDLTPEQAAERVQGVYDEMVAGGYDFDA